MLPQHVLQATIYHCLTSADYKHAVSIAIPAVMHKDRCIGPWELAQAMAEATQQFDRDTREKPDTHLRSIEISNLILDVADVMSSVFRDYFRASRKQVRNLDEEAVQLSNEAAPDETTTDEWFDIEGLLKHRRKKGEDDYSVKWKGTEEHTWQRREDITDAALTHFYAT